MPATDDLLVEHARKTVCLRPRRITDLETGELAYSRCMSTNEARCPACTSLNRLYSMRLIGSGCNVNEQDGVTAEMLSPFVFYFVTLTAPSFRGVHRVGACRCGLKHHSDDDVVSTPLSFSSYRFADQVAWNRDSSELFHYTMGELGRELPDVEWTAAREWQKRGAIHFHVIVRVPRSYDESQVFHAFQRMRQRSWHGQKWGRQHDIKQIRDDGVSKTVGYTAKVVSYTAKSQIMGGGSATRAKMMDRLNRAAARTRCHRRDCVPRTCDARAHSNFGYAGRMRSASQGWSLVELTAAKLHEQRKAFGKEMSRSTGWDEAREWVREHGSEIVHVVDRAYDPEDLARRQRYFAYAQQRRKTAATAV